MKTIENPTILEEYYNNFPLSDFFNFGVKPYVSIVKFDSDESILKEGEVPFYLYYLLDGRAKLYLSHENGRVSLINFLTAPSFIGEMELIGAQPISKGVTAITPCTCYAINIKNCKTSILNDTKFLRYLSFFLSKKALDNTYHYSKNQAYPLENRLATFILMAAHKDTYRERHTEVSEFLGVTYRHLLYVISNFVKKGILVKTEQGYVIKDKAALSNISHL
ncbi:transcriptional regulator YeiL [Paenibacillus sp. NPDC057934]|uniref:transcriptional regulator YeiL n=1 Tax=Paenibacillus sp. NPDC057934 TaxID=3346282 RepID=UPI0036DF9877